MKAQRFAITIAALLVSTGASANDLMTLNPFPHRVEPVLVQVDAQGKLTSAMPAYSLPPNLHRLLNSNLSEMIRAPAIDANGKPMPSQFVMNVALQAKPNGNGDYAIHFAYVSTKPVPAGNWYWVHLDGDQLALANSDRAPNGRQIMPMQRYRDDYRSHDRSHDLPSPTITTPAIQNTAYKTATATSPQETARAR